MYLPGLRSIVFESMKKCKTCKDKKHIKFFPKNGRGGFRNDCKKCHNLKNKE